MTIDQNALEKLFKLITKYQVTELEIDGIKIKKNLHLGKALKPNHSLAPQTHFSIPEDDIMFASSSAPKLSLDDFNLYASNPQEGK